jgi:uncharacterized glyoxalase superfamily protein PhnB
MTKRVSAVPAGFHTITPGLSVRNAAKAIDFYKRAFGTEELMRFPRQDGKGILHAEIKIVADMFWGDRYGRVADPFGHEWGLATHKEDLTPDEIAKRAEAFFAQMAKPQK